MTAMPTTRVAPVEPSTAAPALGRGRRTLSRYAPTLLTVLAFLVVWQVAVIVLQPADYVLPSPLEVAVEADWGGIAAASLVTLQGVALGFLVGNAAGFVMAVAIATSSTAAGIFYPVGLSLRSIPVIALAPFITLAAGRGLLATTTVAALIVFFPTLVNVLHGLRSVEREALELMRVLNAGPVDLFARVRLPAALPALFDALKIAAPAAVLGVMTAEWVIGGSGLGQLILTESLALNTETMWGGIVASTIIAGLAFGLVNIAERLFVPWGFDR